MVGNSGQPGSPEERQPPPARKPTGKTFSCTSCGASVNVRYAGQAMSAVCESCHAVIDVSDENYRILTDYYRAAGKYTLTIPLGTRGELFGKRWEVIGYLLRKDAGLPSRYGAQSPNAYLWEEYLLFNPYYGYRWLTNSSSKWNFVHSIKEKPDLGYKYAILDGNKYQLYNQGHAEVSYVLGEFYWLITAGNKVEMKDYIYPPYMLSSEKDDSGITWSVGEYVKPEVIKKAFNLPKIAQAYGVAPNEPSNATADWKQIKLLFIVALAILTLTEIVHVATATNHKAFESSYPFTPNTKSVNSITTPVFTLNKDMSNLDVVISAPVDNSWFYTGVDLVNDKTGETFPFEKTAEYYHGYEDGEYWSEGSQNPHVLISKVPGGDYYMNMDYESGSYPVNTRDQQFIVSVTRDVPTYANYFWCLFFLSIIPLVSWLAMRRTEIARWKDSDYSPYPDPTANLSP